ncbi:MAG TPA: MFS transporter, partial [Acidimicrobiia bacterium]|nr:MFS transporter [Acidimicrobiia bacterium]
PIVLLSFAGGCVAALVFPFQQAILPELVPRDDLLAAISLGSAGYNFGRVVGPALAGIVIALGSFTWAFALDAVSFLAVVAALLAMRFGPGPKVESGGLFASIREGAAVARRVPGCRSPILLIGTAALLVSPFIALVPAMADVLVEGGASRLAGATGALVTAQGVGAVLGALAIAPIAARIGRRRELVGALVATPLALLAYAASPTVPVAVVTLFLVGAGYIGILSGLATAVQVHAPDAFRGRLISLYFVALGVVYPIGSLIQGAIADRVGLRETTAGGAILMVAAMALLAITRPGVFRALDDPAGTDATPEPAGPHVADPAAPVPTVEGGA